MGKAFWLTSHLLLALLAHVWAQELACPLLNGGCCEALCQQKTCAALHTVGAVLGGSSSSSSAKGSLAWRNRSGWEDVYAAAASDAPAACQQYLAGAAGPAPGYCSWHGIICNATAHSSTCNKPGGSYAVTAIELVNNKLSGNISNAGFVASLQQLHDCGLTKLVLGGASYGLRGEISPGFGKFDKLQVLGIFNTNITGTIPPELGQMTALETLELEGNYLIGSIPPELGNLKNLRLLSLGKNGFTDVGLAMSGPVPASFEQLLNLEVLSLESNAFTGTLPPNMCRKLSRLRGVSLRNNKFRGSAEQFGLCSLVSLDLQDNMFRGSVPVPPGRSTAWRQLVVLRLGNNKFSGQLPDFPYGQAPLLSNVILSNNSLTGTIPLSWATLLPSIGSVDVSFNDLTGTVPEYFAFQTRLLALHLQHNPRMTGTISPWFRLAVSLQSLTLGNTNLYGPLPGITRAEYERGVAAGQLSGRELCGSHAAGLGRLPNLQTASFAATELAATCGDNQECTTIEDALPWYLTPDNLTWQVPLPEPDFSDNAHMECPRLVQEQFCRLNQAAEPFAQGMQPVWVVSPSYYHYIGCRCLHGFNGHYELTLLGHLNITVKRLVCTADRSLDKGQVLGISMAVSVVGVVLASYCLYVSWYGRWGLPRLKRAYDDLTKRRAGAPRSGKVSIVVTDIEGYSALMVAMPLVMGRAVSHHNNAMRKAAWTHYGFVIGQEGDSYLIAFREAVDAVAFCLQVQQALTKIDWPPELLAYQLQQDTACCQAITDAMGSSTSSDSVAQQQQRRQSSASSNAANSALPLSISSGNLGTDGTAAAAGRVGSSSIAGGSVDLDVGPGSRPGSRLWQQGPLRVIGSQQTQVPLTTETSTDWHAQQSRAGATGTPGWEPLRGWQQQQQQQQQHSQPPSPQRLGVRVSSGSGDPQQQLQLQQQQHAQQLVPAVSVLVPGLRVRMGVASGTLGDKERDCLSCRVTQVARVVSDAGAGGQVLVDSGTFSAIKDRLEELGQVRHGGYSRSNRVTGWGTPRGWLARLFRGRMHLTAEVFVLDMGLYTIPGFPGYHAADAARLLPDVPAAVLAMTPSTTSTTASRAAAAPPPPPEAAAAAAPAGISDAGGVSAGTGQWGYHSRKLSQVSEGTTSAAAETSAAAAGPAAAATAAAAAAGGLLRLYQVLAPRLIDRAHLYGNKLSLKSGSALHDLPFFCAPGSTSRSLLDQLLHQSPARLGKRLGPPHKVHGSGGSGSMKSGLSSRVVSGICGQSRAQQQQQQQQQALALSGMLSGSSRSVQLQQQRGRLAGGAWSAAVKAVLRTGRRQQQQRTVSGGSGSSHAENADVSAATASAAAGGGAWRPSSTITIAATPTPQGDSSSLWLLPSSPVVSPRSGGGSGESGDAAVTFVFCSVIMPKQSRLAVDVQVSSQVSAIVSRVLRQCLMALANSTAAAAAAATAVPAAVAAAVLPGNNTAAAAAGAGGVTACGYLCREMAGEMKYLLAFHSPRLALEWCLLVQEVMLWQQWPAAVLDKAARALETCTAATAAAAAAATPTAASTAADANRSHTSVSSTTNSTLAPLAAAAGQQQQQGLAAPSTGSSMAALFRGPKIKMGVAAGAPQAVCPDHLGRADYHGNSINMAARYEAVCSQGGQVVCDAALAAAVVAEWAEMGDTADAHATAAAADLTPTGADSFQQQQVADGVDAACCLNPASPFEAVSFSKEQAAAAAAVAAAAGTAESAAAESAAAESALSPDEYQQQQQQGAEDVLLLPRTATFSSSIDAAQGGTPLEAAMAGAAAAADSGEGGSATAAAAADPIAVPLGAKGRSASSVLPASHAFSFSPPPPAAAAMDFARPAAGRADSPVLGHAFTVGSAPTTVPVGLHTPPAYRQGSGLRAGPQQQQPGGSVQARPSARPWSGPASSSSNSSSSRPWSLGDRRAAAAVGWQAGEPATAGLTDGNSSAATAAAAVSLSRGTSSEMAFVGGSSHAGTASSSIVGGSPVAAGGSLGGLGLSRRGTAFSSGTALPKLRAPKGSRIFSSKGGSGSAVVHMDPTPTELPCSCCVSELPTESFGVEVHQIGKFMVKGQSGPVEMVEVVLAHLTARRFLLPEAPPKSQKGRLLEVQSAKCAAVPAVQFPAVAARYRQQHEQRCAAAAAAAAAIDLVKDLRFDTPTVSGGSRGSLRQRSMPLSVLMSRTMLSFSGAGSASTGGYGAGSGSQGRPHGSFIRRAFSVSDSAGSSPGSSPRAIGSSSSRRQQQLQQQESVPEESV